MNITIHKGTAQIGGCITEIESDGYKIFIDFGDSLPGTPDEFVVLPPIEGLTKGDVSKSLLLISHYHGDHIGKICETVLELSIYMGKTAFEIYQMLENRLSYIPDPKGSIKHKTIIERLKTVSTFETLDQIKIGPFVITPLFVDHSAIDAYMFVIEVEGKSILHTGDFRGHGFKSKGLIPTLKKYVKNIDYIITEGTNIARPGSTILSEFDLQNNFVAQFQKTKFNFVLVSSTNLDRIFSLYHAAKKAKRCFICDDYQMGLMKIVTKNLSEFTNLYEIDYEQISDPKGRFFDLSKDKQNQFSFQGNLKPYLENHGFCMMIRVNDAYKPLLDQYGNSENTKIIFSLWRGYLDSKHPAFNQSMYNFINPYPYEYMHTSGHADVETLETVFQIVKPKKGIIPIHTSQPELFKTKFSNRAIISLRDGEQFSC